MIWSLWLWSVTLKTVRFFPFFIPDTIVFLFFLQILLLFSKTTSPVKLSLWCDSAKFALNYPTGHFHGNRLLFFRCSLFLKIFQVGFNFLNLRVDHSHCKYLIRSFGLCLRKLVPRVDRLRGDTCPYVCPQTGLN